MEKHADREYIKVEIQNEGTFSLSKGENVLSVLIEQGLFDVSHCGGHGTCGKCAVCFATGAPLPLPADRRRFSPGELRDGWRLACMAKPQMDCLIRLPQRRETEFILDRTLLGGLGKHLQTTCDERETVAVADLGTTSIVVLLVEKRTGRILSTYKRMNPQRRYGADVISRMEHAMGGKQAELSGLVNDVLAEAIGQWQKQGHAPQRIYLAGNTVMIHLLNEYPVDGLSKAPFVPVTTDAVPFAIAGVEGTALPGISAFVGGDITAGMLVCRETMKKDGVRRALLIDLGTNGEMVLFTETKDYCTATAAGPAFEGGFGNVIFGSDVIRITASLLEREIIDGTGLLAEPYFENGFHEGGVCIRQEDIRALQMAKAAVFAGIRILMEEAGISETEIERVYLAGGFGFRLDIQSACAIGLIPSVWRERTVAAGNTALAGAYLYGCMEGRGALAADITKEMTQKTISINLAEKERFHDYYLRAMNLREERDFS